MVEILYCKKGATGINLNIAATNLNIWGISMFYCERVKNIEFVRFTVQCLFLTDTNLAEGQ
jgi:hypothetical protein